MLFASGVVEGQLPQLPCTLEDGSISGGVDFRGMIPLPCVVEVAVRFEARNLYGDLVAIRGVALEVKAVGEASYVEEFPGSCRSEPLYGLEGQEGAPRNGTE
jgi:hypothetical protein